MSIFEQFKSNVTGAGHKIDMINKSHFSMLSVSEYVDGKCKSVYAIYFDKDNPVPDDGVRYFDSVLNGNGVKFDHVYSGDGKDLNFSGFVAKVEGLKN